MMKIEFVCEMKNGAVSTFTKEGVNFSACRRKLLDENKNILRIRTSKTVKDTQTV